MVPVAPGVLLAIALAIAAAYGGAKVVKSTDRHIVRPITHTIKKVVRHL